MLTQPIIPSAPPAPSYAGRRVSGTSSSKHFSQLDLIELNAQTRKWLSIAREEGVNINKEWNKLQWTILDGLSILNQTQQMSEVLLVQQVTIRRLSCCQIIRKVTRHRIENFAIALSQINGLQDQLRFINRCKNWLLKYLPPKIFLLSPDLMEDHCKVILSKIEEIRRKILLRQK
jgi:hypothetical protein